MTTDQLFEKLSGWVNNGIISNPSKQNQLLDHCIPYAASTLFLMTLPYGKWIGLVVPVVALYKELVEDSHWRDLFSKTESGADGRIDLFLGLVGCGAAYATLIWR